MREFQLSVNRRQFFGRSATGIGTAALVSLLSREGLLGAEPGPRGLAGFPNRPPRAKRVIYLFQNGGPTHLDLFALWFRSNP